MFHLQPPNNKPASRFQQEPLAQDFAEGVTWGTALKSGILSFHW